MPYRMGSAVHDAALQYIADNCDRQVVTSDDPVDYAGVASVTLASTAMVGGDFTLAAGDISGRKLTIGAKSNITPTTNGTGNHIVLVDDGNSAILLQVPIPNTPLNTSTPVDFASWIHESRDNEAG